MRCVDCGYTSGCFGASVVGIKEGAFTLQSKCPACGSAKVLFTKGEFEEQVRILIAKKREPDGLFGETNRSRGFVLYHLRELLLAAVGEAQEDGSVSRHLHARANLRLITMSDEEMWELAKMTACPPKCPVEMNYQRLKQTVEGLKQTAAEWTKDLSRKTMPDSEERTNGRVLIVGSEPTSGKELASAFTQAGFIVFDAPDYTQALQRLSEFKPDAIIIDSLLPDRNGFEACSELRSRFDIPVVLLGKDSGAKVWEKVIEADADFYEVEPCIYSTLVARVNAILRRYRVSALGSSNDPGYRKEP